MKEIRKINLGLRFLVEVSAVLGLAFWGWTTNSGLARIGLTVGLPILAMVLWATFRTPGDGGEPIVPISGPVRLGLELALFGTAIILVYRAGMPAPAAGLGGLVTVHYLLDRNRVVALLKDQITVS